MALYLVREKMVGSLYCGPLALCSVTGASPERIIEEIQTHRGDKRPVVSMRILEVRDILSRLHRKTRMMYYAPGKIRLQDYCEKLRRRRDFRNRIVFSPGHAVATNGLLVYDTYVPSPVVPESHPKKNSGVWGAIIIG